MEALSGEVAEYNTKGPSSALIGIGVGAMMVLAGLGLTFASTDQSGFPFALLCMGVMVVAAAGVSLFSVLRHAGTSVRLYLNGFALTTRAGSEEFPWVEIEAVWQSITRSRRTTHYQYTVQRRDGQRAVFTSRQFDPTHIRALGTRIQEEVAALQLPRSLDALKRGQTLQFGPVTLTWEAISNGDETIPWAEVEEVRLAGGFVSIKTAQKWARWNKVLTSQIPNLLVFDALAQRFSQQRAELAT